MAWEARPRAALISSFLSCSAIWAERSESGGDAPSGDSRPPVATAAAEPAVRGSVAPLRGSVAPLPGACAAPLALSGSVEPLLGGWPPLSLSGSVAPLLGASGPP